MKNKRLLLLVFLGLLILSSTSAYAAPAFLNSPFLQSFWEWLKTPVAWPPFHLVDFPPQAPEQIPPGIIIMVTAMTTAVIWAVTRQRVPIFADDRFRSAALWFSLSLVGIAVTSSGYVGAISGIIGGAFDVGSLIFFVIAIFILIALGKWGAGFMGGGGRIGEAIGHRAGQAERAVADRIAGQEHGEEQRLAGEAQLFQQLDSLEGAGIRDAETLEGYINELINVLGRGQSVRQVREGVNERLTRLNPAFQTLVRINARATALDTELNTLITNETTNLQRLMRTVRQRQITPAGAGAAAPVPRADATLMTRYIGDMTRRMQDARANAQRISRDRPALATLETQLRARLTAGFAALAAPGRDADRLRNARTEFIAARGVVSQLIARMHEIELAAERIRNDLRAEVRDINAEDHLARAGVA